MDNGVLRANGSNMAIRVAILAAALAICIAPASAQTVSGVSGTLQHGASLVITGSNFGTKPTASPLIFDDVEGGSFDSRWSSTTHMSPSGAESRHANSAGCGTVNFRGYESGGWFTGGSNNAGPWFCQYWFKLDDDWNWGSGTYGEMGANLANIKIFRMWETGPADEDFVIATEGWGGSCIWTVENVAAGNVGWFEGDYKQNWSKGTWHLFQFEYKDSDVGQNNGVIRMWRDGRLVLEKTNLLTRENYSAFKRPFILGFYNSWGDASTDDNHFYIDDAYIDTSWARVELGNASTYGACTHREVQLPTSWSTSQVAVTVNQGSFTGGQQAYLFVVNANGQASPGFPVTVSGTTESGPGQPGKPTF